MKKKHEYFKSNEKTQQVKEEATKQEDSTERTVIYFVVFHRFRF